MEKLPARGHSLNDINAAFQLQTCKMILLTNFFMFSTLDKRSDFSDSSISENASFGGAKTVRGPAVGHLRLVQTCVKRSKTFYACIKLANRTAIYAARLNRPLAKLGWGKPRAACPRGPAPTERVFPKISQCWKSN